MVYAIFPRVSSVRCMCCGSIYPWLNFYFPFVFSMLIYDNEYETEEKKKIEP